MAKSKTRKKPVAKKKNAKRAAAKKTVAKAKSKAKPTAKLAPSRSTDPLVLIARKDFERAMSLLAKSSAAAAALDSVADVFNYATAQWGHAGAPPLNLFNKALDLSETAKWDSDNADSANFHQCRALMAAVVGNASVAKEALGKSRQLAAQLGASKEFSAWRYKDVSPTEFRRDLEAIERMLEGASVQPAFL
jgi:hypothetical protein